MSDLNNMQPIIILGAGRSGTKFFRDSLLSSKATCAVPYDVNYIWRYGNEECEHDELTAKMATNSSNSYIRQSIVRLASKQNNNAQFLLEKTVSNGLRVDFVNEVFPEAKYIHLVRDGRAVVESAIRVWNEPPQTGYLLKKIKYFPWKNYKYAFQYFLNLARGVLTSNSGLQVWGPKYSGIQHDVDNLSLIEICAKQWERCVSRAMTSLRKIPKERVLTIKYEDFVSSPQALSEAARFIGVQDTENLIANYAKKLRPGNVDKWRESLSEPEIEYLSKSLEGLLSELGYSE